MVTVSTLAAVAVDGLAFGFFLALLGVGITLVFGLGEVLNLAIGMFAVIAAMAAVTVQNSGVGFFPAALVGILFVGVFGLVVDQSLLSLVYRSEGEERILLGIFVTLGLTVLLEGILFNYYPSSYSLSFELGTVSVGDFIVVGSSLAIIAVALVLLGVIYVFLKATFLGKATRTVFQDETGALLVGVNPRRVRTLIFVLSTVVAGVAGIVYAIGSGVEVTSGFEFTIFALIVSIVGGVRSLEGAVAAGLLLGLVISFANFFIGSFVASLIMFVTAIVVLLAKPEVIA